MRYVLSALILAVLGLAAFPHFEPQITTFLKTTPQSTLAIIGFLSILGLIELDRASKPKKKKED
jgi:hypothetical protein